VNVEIADKRLITEGDAVQPSWSPHGHRIAYWTNKDPEGKRTGQRDIWTVPANGGEAVPVTEDAHVDWNPVWSPEGAYLCFSSNRGGSMNLWRVPIEEPSGRPLGPPAAVTMGAAASNWHPCLTNDGKRIAYVERVEYSNIWQVPLGPATGTTLDLQPPLVGRLSKAPAPGTLPSAVRLHPNAPPTIYNPHSSNLKRVVQHVV
jgi:Tol biopolymer transport system component